MDTVQCTQGRGADHPFFCISAMVQYIGTDKPAAQSGATLRHMHSRYSPNSNSFICGASHRDAVSTIFKVLTRPRVN